MCLGEIGRVCAVSSAGMLVVDLGGRVMNVSAMLVDAVPDVGDWVVVHAGFAIGQLSEAEARETLALRKALQ